MSRLIVQVVLRDSTSISPDCSAVKRSLAVSGVNLTLVASPKTAAATARQIIDVEAGPVALVVGRREAGEAGVDAAAELPRSYVVERLGLRAGGAGRGDEGRRSSRGPPC